MLENSKDAVDLYVFVGVLRLQLPDLITSDSHENSRMVDLFLVLIK